MATQKRKLDITSSLGLIIALAAIVGGLSLEGGGIGELLQGTAAVIVLGGTLGATLVTTPKRLMRVAIAKTSDLFYEPDASPANLINQIAIVATKARKSGLISIEDDLDSIEDPFLKKAVALAVDGTDPKDFRQMMELDLRLEQQQYEDAARVFGAAGGYAPTIGIIGAVLGLMQVMKNLTNISEVGHGIATAFVATIYGVALANLVLLPASGKLMSHAGSVRQMRELAILGVVGILEGLNPKLLRIKLEAFLIHWDPKSYDQYAVEKPVTNEPIITAPSYEETV